MAPINTGYVNELPNADMEESIQRDDVLKYCVGSLPERCREAIERYYFDQQPIEHIAKSMGFSSAQAFRTLKCRCLKKLRFVVKNDFKKEDFFTEISYH